MGTITIPLVENGNINNNRQVRPVCQTRKAHGEMELKIRRARLRPEGQLYVHGCT